jgi:antitoxin component YwqK of YwqJK toxin-antitoxin module
MIIREYIGKYKEEYFIFNNIIEGEYKKYYENGKLEIICTVKCII